MVNILLYLAEQSNHYYPTSEVGEMLSTFLPLLTKEVRTHFLSASQNVTNILLQTILTMVPVMTSFLPIAGAKTYLPVLFTIWEAFNSNVLDDRLLEIVGKLAEEFVSGAASSDDGLLWKDVGIWTEAQWSILMTKCLASMRKFVSLWCIYENR